MLLRIRIASMVRIRTMIRMVIMARILAILAILGPVGLGRGDAEEESPGESSGQVDVLG